MRATAKGNPDAAEWQALSLGTGEPGIFKDEIGVFPLCLAGTDPAGHADGARILAKSFRCLRTFGRGRKGSSKEIGYA